MIILNAIDNFFLPVCFGEVADQYFSVLSMKSQLKEYIGHNRRKRIGSPRWKLFKNIGKKKWDWIVGKKSRQTTLLLECCFFFPFPFFLNVYEWEGRVNNNNEELLMFRCYNGQQNVFVQKRTRVWWSKILFHKQQDGLLNMLLYIPYSYPFSNTLKGRTNQFNHARGKRRKEIMLLFCEDRILYLMYCKSPPTSFPAYKFSFWSP